MTAADAHQLVTLLLAAGVVMVIAATALAIEARLQRRKPKSAAVRERGADA